MAKTEGTQSIPSALLDAYRGTLTEQQPDGVSRKRYPYRVPNMQEGGSDVKPGQKAQRTRFKESIANFHNVSAADRARWYAARPPWSSLLWYYNYYIMSDLTGNANQQQGGVGVIKSIQVMKASVPTTGSHEYTLDTEVDAAKTVVMLFGSARKVPAVYRGSGAVATGGATLNIGDTVDPNKCTVKLNGASYKEVAEGVAIGVLPIVTALSSTQITINWPFIPDSAVDIGWEITEHVEGSVFPIIVSITDTIVDIDWAEEPDAAADVSILVIEYI